MIHEMIGDVGLAMRIGLHLAAPGARVESSWFMIPVPLVASAVQRRGDTSSWPLMACRREHHEGCGHDHGDHSECDHEIEDPDGQSLFGAIDTTKCRCLNESVAGSCVNPFKPYAKVRVPLPLEGFLTQERPHTPARIMLVRRCMKEA
jgi:hypothetical protein